MVKVIRCSNCGKVKDVQLSHGEMPAQILGRKERCQCKEDKSMIKAFKTISLDDPKIHKEGFAPTIKDKGETFYFVGGSMQYFGGDVERIQKILRERGIKYRTVLVVNPKGVGNWLIYVNTQKIHLEDVAREGMKRIGFSC